LTGKHEDMKYMKKAGGIFILPIFNMKAGREMGN
jgi:hypothetical protein